MTCFTHPDRPAVGVCMQCGKGLCATCSCDTAVGLSCGEEHGRILKMKASMQALAVRSMTPAWQRRLERAVLFGILAYVTFLIQQRLDEYRSQSTLIVAIFLAISLRDAAKAFELRRRFVTKAS